MEVMLSEISEILLRANPAKPWMTAQSIAKKMRESDPALVEATLLNYITGSDSSDKVLRYSSLPSRSTLQVLWGHTKYVGSKDLLPLTKTQEATTVEGFDTSSNAGTVFFSHSHKDFRPVVSAAQQLGRDGVNVWLAETHIQKTEMIHCEIIEALSRCDVFLVFMSRNSLKSRWTGKELARAVSRNIPIFVLWDDSNGEIDLNRFTIAGRNIDSFSLFRDAFLNIGDQTKRALIRHILLSEYWNNASTLNTEIKDNLRS